jgi:hypothetical protein
MTLARLPPMILLAGWLVAAHAASAQTATPPAANPVPPSPEGQRSDQRIERIRVEDSGSRIDEVRVGGETQSITVSPKGGMPAYEVLPPSANRPPSVGERNSNSASGGTRVWKIFGF